MNHKEFTPHQKHPPQIIVHTLQKGNNTPTQAYCAWEAAFWWAKAGGGSHVSRGGLSPTFIATPASSVTKSTS